MDFSKDSIDRSLINTKKALKKLKRSKEGSTAEIVILLITNASDSPRTPIAMFEDAFAPRAFQDTCQRFARACTLEQRESIQAVVEELAFLLREQIEREIKGSVEKESILRTLVHEARTLVAIGKAFGCAFVPS